ncbi:GNAT family N-acetyltransferase [uncultured Bradyrhizobium sp.]|uniref:GNAT family N-acetyltransferase n=1 Tax=uncultured Bradyrhizobium sp. TaxID=199684 RepID=UPI0035C986AC
MSQPPRITWCQDPARARELAEFFARNVEATTAYISHSEMWGDRALSPHKWRSGLPQIFEAEIEPKLRISTDALTSSTCKPILVAEDQSGLLALAYVTFDGAAPVPYGIVEDIVVDPAKRGQGVGKYIIDWIAEQARKRDIHRLFLESGESNHGAHDFFESVGFKKCSIVMLKTL